MGKNCLSKASEVVAGSLEKVFYKYGKNVATHRWKYICACLLVTACCCVGLINFYNETRPEKLWIPQDSDYVTNLAWQKENFPNDQRIQFILYEADNILKAEYVQEMYRVKKELKAVVVKDKYDRDRTEDDLCSRVEAPGLIDGPFDEFPTACLELSILEIWGDDDIAIEALTDEDVVNAVNNATSSATFGFPLDFASYLGEVERDAEGAILSARTSLTQLFMKINRTEVDLEGIVSEDGAAEEVDDGLYNWEGEFISILSNDTDRPQGLEVYFQSQRSFGEIAGETIVGDVLFLAIGCLILFIYVQVMLGKFNWVETRPLLSLLGLLATFMAVGISFGLCSAFGIAYGPVHSVLPLLMLGLGVDDMFVIMQCWHNLKPEERSQSLPKRIGCALRHAGVAITVTSLTDFVAFAIGASTVLPALQSFCIYCAIGIVALYILQATFFVAWFTLDQTRLEDSRNGLFWCYKHKNWTPNKCSRRDFCQMFFDKIYSKMLVMKPVKALVLVATATMLGLGIWGVTNLRQEFEPIWFLPPSSYLYQFFEKLEYFYPEDGERGTVYLGALDYPQELMKIGILTDNMRLNEYISSVDSWYDSLVDFTNATYDEDIRGRPLNESFFAETMTGFLFSLAGFRYQSNFVFDGNLTETDIPTILASKFDYRHRPMDGPSEQIPAMDEMIQMVEDADFSDFAAPIAMAYSDWETDKIIGRELTRNLILAMVAVFLMTLVLLASIMSSLYVLTCVVLTLVDVMALMAWWDLTIDTVSCINLVLAIGLCVDYSVHIALHFLQVKGTRDERVHQTVTEMGPAVVNGAFSTFLAFILLATSESHVFESFFKIFFGVFIFGVFHGLVFLPVLLSLIGPAPYDSDADTFPVKVDLDEHATSNGTSKEKSERF